MSPAFGRCGLQMLTLMLPCVYMAAAQAAAQNKAYMKHPEKHPADGVSYVGQGQCVDSRGEDYSAVYMNLGPGFIGPLVRRCAEAANKAADMEPSVLGFQVKEIHGLPEQAGAKFCYIYVQPGFANPDADWVHRVSKDVAMDGRAWLNDGRGYGRIDHTGESSSTVSACYKVEKPSKSAQAESQIKDQAKKVCEGSGNGQIGTGQTGSVCCQPKDGSGMCCVGTAANDNDVQVKVMCSGSHTSRLFAIEDKAQSKSMSVFGASAVMAAVLIATIMALVIRARRLPAEEEADMEME